MDVDVNEPKVGGLDFGRVLELLKQGAFVAREGWNGKGMYLWLMPPATIPADWCKEPHLKHLAEANGGMVEVLGTIRMKTADNKVLTDWLASQTDMLAEDWCVVHPAAAGEASAGLSLDSDKPLARTCEPTGNGQTCEACQ